MSTCLHYSAEIWAAPRHFDNYLCHTLIYLFCLQPSLGVPRILWKNPFTLCVCRKLQQFPNSLWNDKNRLFVVFILILEMNIGNHCFTEKQLNTFLQTLLKASTGNFTLRKYFAKNKAWIWTHKINFFCILGSKSLTQISIKLWESCFVSGKTKSSLDFLPQMPGL